jgi:hypothetical protein
MKVTLSHFHLAPFLGKQQMHIYLSSAVYHHDNGDTPLCGPSVATSPFMFETKPTMYDHLPL